MWWSSWCRTGVVVATVVSCAPPGASTCEDGSLDCYNLDKPIDGFGSDEGLPVVPTDARMCVAGDGVVYGAWIDGRESDQAVWLTVSRDGGDTFDRPVRAKSSGAGDASGLAMTCTGDRVFVAWEDTRDSDTDYTNIYFNVSNDGGRTFMRDDVAVDADPDGRAISLAPQIAFRGANIYVTWFDQVAGAPDVYVASSVDNGATFSDPVRVSGCPGEGGMGLDDRAGLFWSGNPRTALDDEGTLHVVWEDTRKSGGADPCIAGQDPDGGSGDPTRAAQDIYHARVVFNANGRPRTATQTRLTKGATPGTSFGFAPDLALDGTTVWVVWHDTRGGDARDVYVNTSADGGRGWLDSAARVESDAPGAAQSLNAKVLARGGTAHVVWQDNRNGGYDIFYRAVTPGAISADGDGLVVTGDEEVRLDTDAPGGGNSVQPRITANADTLVVAWSDLRASSEQLNDLYYNFRPIDDGDWAGEDLRLDSVVAGTKFTADLNIGLFEDTVYAMWIDNRDGEGDQDVYFSASPLGEGVDLYEDVVQLEPAAAE